MSSMMLLLMLMLLMTLSMALMNIVIRLMMWMLQSSMRRELDCSKQTHARAHEQRRERISDEAEEVVRRIYVMWTFLSATID